VATDGVWAIIFVHAYTMYVYVFLFVSAGLERYDTTLDEAAAGLGASSWQRLRRVTLPLLMPAIAGSMLLVFMTALGSFRRHTCSAGNSCAVYADRRVEAQRRARSRLCRNDVLA
jgi:iron(III) transport system permease protein